MNDRILPHQPEDDRAKLTMIFYIIMKFLNGHNHYFFILALGLPIILYIECIILFLVSDSIMSSNERLIY